MNSSTPDRNTLTAAQAASRKSTVRNVAWNYAGYASQLAINIGLTSYIVRHLSVVEYGLFLFVMSLSATLYLLDMGISSVLVQAYVEAMVHHGSDRLNDLLSTAFLALAALGAFGVLIFCGIAAWLPGPFNIPQAYLHEAATIFIIAALVIQVGLPSMAIEHVYQASHRFDRTNQIQLVISTVLVILSVLVLAAGYGIVALAVIQLVVALVKLLLLAAGLGGAVPGAHFSLARFRGALLKPLVHLSKWAFLSNISAYLFDMLVWILLGSFGSMSEVALFGLASKPPKQLWKLVDKGANVTLPLMSKSAAENDVEQLRQTYLRTQKLTFGAVLPFIILGCLFARPLIVVWAGQRYAEAALVMQWLLLGAFSQAIAYASDLLLYSCGEVKKAAKISLWSGTASVLAALALVSHYGAVGLAAGMAITQLILNGGWFTLAACRLAGVSLSALLRAMFQGLALPLTVLGTEVLVVSRFRVHLSAAWLVSFAIGGGLIYMALWGFRTALPLYRNYTEVVA